jgi:hypothetical protein
VNARATSLALRPNEKKFLATVGTVVLGTVVLGFAIVNRDWRRERAHDLAMSGRGSYR